MTWRRWMLRAAFGIVFFSAVADASTRAATKNPFALARRVDGPTRWSGRVVSRLKAGSYIYLQVTRDGAPPAWVVTAEALAPDADRVHVHVIKVAERFRSARLNRSFSPLHFSIVRREEP